MSKKRISMGEIMAYSFGLFGLQFIIGYMNSYQAQFFNKTMAADLAIIGIIVLVAKVISSFADPFIGRLIDNGKFKCGKLKPFILIAVFPLFILTILLFIALPLKGVWLYIYMFIAVLLWNISMSLADIPSQGMLAMLSPNPFERNRIAGFANFIKNIGLSGCYLLVPIVCIITKSEGGAIGEREFLISAIFIAVIGSVLFSLIYFFNKERVPYESNNVSIKEMFFMLKENKPLMLILLSFIIGAARCTAMCIQTQAAHALIGSINLFGTTIGGENTIIILGGTCAIGTAIGMIFVPMLTQKLGAKKVFIVTAVYGIFITTLVFILYVLGFKSVLAIVICLFFVGLMYGSHSYLPIVMVADCVDYYEYKTGKRTEGVHYAVLSFGIKISFAIGMAIGLSILGASGYNANDEVFSTKTKNIIYFAYVLVPGISCILAMIPILFYNLDGKFKQDITAELERRHLQKD